MEGYSDYHNYSDNNNSQINQQENSDLNQAVTENTAIDSDIEDDIPF